MFFRSNCTLNVLDVLTTLLKKTSISLWPTFMRIYKMLMEKLSVDKKPDIGLFEFFTCK